MTTADIVSQTRLEAQAAERRRSFIERMERKLAYKAALQRSRRAQFRVRVARLRWS